MMACGVVAQEIGDVLSWSQARQGQIRSQTDEVGKSIDEMIEEYQLNGLGGEDLKALSAVRQILGNLSEQQMARVVELLGQARATEDGAKSRQLAATAVADQKSIVAQLRRLLIEFQKQQAMLDLSIRMKALSERQDNNLKESVKLAKEIAGKQPTAIREDQRLAQSMAQSEQQAIRDEIEPILSQLGKMAQDPENLLRDRVEKALKEAEGLREAMEGAVEGLRQGNLYNAAGMEKTIRDDLRDLARGVMPPRSKEDAIKDVIADLNKAIDAQEKAMESVKGATGDQAPGLEPAEASVVDKTDQVRQDVEDLSPLIAGELKTAMGSMQQARSELSAKKPKEALGNESKALDQLSKVKGELEKLAESARDNPAEDMDPAKAAAAAREQVADLLNREQTLSSQLTSTSNVAEQSKTQKELAQKASELSRSVNDPTARDALAEAAEQMGKASEQLDKNNRKSAKEAQNAAISSLGKAKSAVDQNAAAMEKMAKELAELEKQRESAEDLARRQDAMELSTEMGERSKPDPVGAAAQEALSRETKQMADGMGESPAGAKSEMARAAEEMTQASKEIGEGKIATAQQENASDSMRRAIGAMDRKMDELSRKMGKSSADPGELAAAGKGISEAREKTDEAKKEIDGGEGQSAGTVGKLAEASKQAGELSMTRGMPSGAADALRQASAALKKAAAFAKSNQGGQARQAAQEASESLAQASAMALMASAGSGKTDELSPGGKGNRKDIGGAANADGPRGTGDGSSAYMGLPARDREAIVHSTTEGKPQEYTAQIEQYLRNLSDQENEK